MLCYSNSKLQSSPSTDSVLVEKMYLVESDSVDFYRRRASCAIRRRWLINNGPTYKIFYNQLTTR